MSAADSARVTRILDEVSGVKAQYGITDWEWEFLRRMKALAQRGFTEKQSKVIGQIEAKVFGEKDADE